MMDTSEKYSKMADCSEIQKRWRPDGYPEYLWGRFGGGIMWDKTNNLSGVIWLPCQDQLQKMIWTPIMSNYQCAKDLAIDFGMWIQQVLGSHKYRINKLEMSMEQLWLAFVMHEKHGKTWDDKKGKWVEIKREKGEE